MRNTLVIIGILSFVNLAAILYGFMLVGSPFDAKSRQEDKATIMKVESTASEIFGFYMNNQTLPNTISQIPRLSTGTTKPLPEYHTTSETTFDVCVELKVSSKEGQKLADKVFSQSDSYGLSYSSFTYDKGPNCLHFSVTPKAPRGTTTATKPAAQDETLVEDFEDWHGSTLLGSWYLPTGLVTKSTKASSKQYAIEFPGTSETLLASPGLKAGSIKRVQLSFKYDTLANCTDCILAGFRIYNSQNTLESSDVTNCGSYSPHHGAWFTYVIAPTKGFETFTMTCTLPQDATKYQAVIGIWDKITSPLTVDYLTMQPIKSDVTPNTFPTPP